MENLNPAQSLILALKFGLERGESVKASIARYLQESPSELTPFVARWTVLRETGQDPEPLLKKLRSPYRQAVMRTLDRGLMGETIYPALCQMDLEISDSVRGEIDAFLGTLPLKMLIPLLLLQFPAFLILLLGPLMKELLKGF